MKEARSYLLLGLTLFALPSFAAEEVSCFENKLALTNGQIHTMDDDNIVVNSVLIVGNRFAALDPEARTFDECTQVVDLQQRTVIPGLIDNHVHYIRLANRPGYDHRELEATFTLAEALESIRAKVADVPTGALITTIGGIRRTQWAENRFPSIEELDAVAPDNPVFLSERGFGPGQANTLARNLLRQRDVPVSDDGVVAGRPNSGLAYTALAEGMTNDHRKRQMLDVADYALARGMTTVMDMSGTVPGVGYIDPATGYDFFLELDRDNLHKVRTRIYFPGGDADANLEQLMGYLDNKWHHYGSDMARIVGIGEWSVGRSLFNEKPLGDAARLAQRRIAERGWTYHQHLHTPEEIDAHFDVWEELNEEFDLAALRWTPGHLSFITPELIQRAKAMGLGLGAHGQRYHTGEPGGPPWRTLIESDLVALAAGSDGARINSLNPWAMIYYMVTGLDVGGVMLNDGEQISRHAAVRLYASSDQGWFTKEDDSLGGIAVGRFADLAVLDANFFDENVVPDDAIRSMRSVLTVVNGEIVFGEASEL